MMPSIHNAMSINIDFLRSSNIQGLLSKITTCLLYNWMLSIIENIFMSCSTYTCTTFISNIFFYLNTAFITDQFLLSDSLCLYMYQKTSTPLIFSCSVSTPQISNLVVMDSVFSLARYVSMSLFL